MCLKHESNVLSTRPPMPPKSTILFIIEDAELAGQDIAGLDNAGRNRRGWTVDIGELSNTCSRAAYTRDQKPKGFVFNAVVLCAIVACDFCIQHAAIISGIPILLSAIIAACCMQ